MKRRKKILERFLLFGSIFTIIIFIIGLILISTIPYSEATYKYSWGKYIKIEVKVEDNEVTITTLSFDTITIEEFDSIIKKGKIYIKEDPTKSEYTELGKINSLKLELTRRDDNSAIPFDLILECKLTKVLQTINIVMICIGGVSLATSVGVILYDKAQAKKEDPKPSQEA